MQNSKPLKKSENPAERKCYYPALSYSIRDGMTRVVTNSDHEVCQRCCYPCTLPVPYVDSMPIIDVSCIPIIWVLGGTDADKQVQCNMILEQEYCMVHISVKKMLCTEVTTGSKRSDIIKMMVNKGAQVPSELILSMIKEKIAETKNISSGYLITGFPRERSHGAAFAKAIASPCVVIYLQVSIETLVRREMARRPGPQQAPDEIEIRKKLDKIQTCTDDILHDFWEKVRCVNAERAENEICFEILQILHPVLAEKLAYKNKKKMLKKLLVGQS